jgi:hypothetical protein
MRMTHTAFFGTADWDVRFRFSGPATPRSLSGSHALCRFARSTKPFPSETPPGMYEARNTLLTSVVSYARMHEGELGGVQ